MLISNDHNPNIQDFLTRWAAQTQCAPRCAGSAHQLAFWRRPSRRDISRSGYTAFLSAALTLGAAAASMAQYSIQLAPGQTGAPALSSLSPRTIQQIGALEAEASSRTPAQKKLDSHLWYAAKAVTGRSIAAGIPALRNSLVQSSNGYAEVDITADVTDGLLSQIVAVGGKVISSHPEYSSIRASMPLAQLEWLAGFAGVRFIKPAERPLIQGQSIDSPAVARTRSMRYVSQYFRRPAKERREELLRDRLPAMVKSLMGTPGVATLTGGVTSEGDVTHRANLARNTFHADGTGIKIGVISDSDDFLESSQASGDLGAVTVLAGQSGRPGSGEGTAMMEIVHDVVPGASIYFATCGNTQADFAANIKALAAAGCKVIVDDIAFTSESPFQDGIPAQAVQAVTAQGVIYFSSADNYGNLTDFTSGVWTGDFLDAGATLNDAGGGKLATVNQEGNTRYYGNRVTDNSGNGQNAVLFWDDPLGHSSNDYNLYVVDSDVNIVDASTNVQSGTQDPFEFIGGVPDGDYLLIVQHSGANRFLHLDLSSQNGKLAVATASRTRGHATVNAVGAYGVAATPAAGATPNYGAPTGPYPNPFNSTNQTEYFSSDGPSHLFYNTDGTAITPTNLTSTGGLIVQKPDITAADGVTTSLNGNVTKGESFDPFFGTSAAAPHAAAITALLLSYAPSLTQTQVRSLLTSTAIDIMDKGPDRDSGAGIIDAYALLSAAPKAAPAITSFTPASGPVGTKVTITGTNLTGATAVKFHGTPSTVITVVNATTVTATVPTGATTGTISVTTPNGTVTSTASYTVSAIVPTVTSFTPATGPVGTVVTITGTHFTGATGVMFNGTSSTTVKVGSDTTITATVPAGATTGKISVNTPNGSAVSTASFTVSAAASSIITAFQPATGPVGTNVTIAGTNLTGATAVTIGGKAATSFTVLSPTCISAVVGDGAITGNIVVTTPGGTATSAAKFTVTASAPTVTTYSPASGAIGTKVTVTGTNLTGATAVKFNGYVSTSVVVLSATSLTATVPTGATTGNISVTTPGGLAYSATAFVVTPAAPTVTVFAPTTGYAGTKVTIKGTNLLGTSAVTFNGVAATSITSVTATSLIATVPAGATTGTIAVTTPGGTATTAGSFTVTAAPPTIVAFQGTSGPVGTKVIIAGTNLTGTNSVKFNGKAATVVTVLSDQFVQVTVPAGATTGTIALTTPAGTATSAAKFTVTP